MANPGLPEDQRLTLVKGLMPARRAVRSAKLAGDLDTEGQAHRQVDHFKQALGERGPVWWTDGAADLNRHMARTTPYADWFARLTK